MTVCGTFTSGAGWSGRGRGLVRDVVLDQAEALGDADRPLGVELDAVALAEVGHLLRGWGARQLAHLAEEVVEATRRDDLEDSARRVAGVPERVPLVARLEDEVAGVGVDLVVSE